MDDMTEQTGRRERMGPRPWVRSAAMIGGGLVAGGILAGTLTANAATDTAAAAPAATSYSAAAGGTSEGPAGAAPTGNGDPSQPQGSDEHLLTGDTATKVTDVVEAKYPDATIQRVETDSDGVYEAHIVTADGEQLIVQVGEDFSITGTQQFGGR
jgi:hypothetical protein